MTRLFHPAVPITVELDADGSPRQFRWQERLHQVARVEQCWQVDTDWWTPAGRASRAYFALTTQTGLLCVVYHDRLAAAWCLSCAYD
jgi:hypothetical protein